MWVAERALNTIGAFDLFQAMRNDGKTVEAKVFLVAMLNDRILTGYSPNRLSAAEAGEYYLLLDLPPELYPPQARGVEPETAP